MTLSIVVPTRHEAGNVDALVQRLHEAFGDSPVEIIFVDDSDDDTPDRIRAVVGRCGRPVLLLHRPRGERAGGLGSAVLMGLRACAGEWAVVMDGDLQHPPEVIPDLVAAGSHADIVVGSRYAGAGSAAGLGSLGRFVASGGATRLTKAVFPLRLRGCSDPMSGLFAVRLGSLDLDRLRPNGFKVLLEVLARSPRLRIREYAFTFGSRTSGRSKASWREAGLLVRRLVALRTVTLLGPRFATVAGFLAVGLSGVLVNSIALWALVATLGAPVLLGATVATQASTTWNFLLADRLVFPGPKARRPVARYLSFVVINNVALLGRLPVLALLVHRVGVGYLLANAFTLTAAFAVRFALSDRLVFSRRDTMTTTVEPSTKPGPGWDRPAPTSALVGGRGRNGPVDLVVDVLETEPPAARRRPAATRWHYDIHGIVRLDSAVRLPELASFQTSPGGSADIVIRAGTLTGGRPRARARVTQYALSPAVCYQEQPGRFGSDFLVDMSDNIEVVVGPMLVRSPHVLYTNVVEALLRFVLVSRGCMLLHSACVELEGRGVLLSALTDTGKTGTVLRLVRENASRFLSDDMTILDATGTARCFPKPLTISQHTLRAVQAGDLTPREWRRLRVQSRLHSKEGRGIGTRLGEMNLPIMTLNAITQYVVPPPKYDIERLVPCRRATSVRIEDLFVIERDEFRLTDIEPSGLIDELIANTDDAYGFPPFRYFAPALVVGGEGYEELRAQERRILADAMGGVRARRLATPDYTWADHIPALVAAASPSPAPPGGNVLAPLFRLDPGA